MRKTNWWWVVGMWWIMGIMIFLPSPQKRELKKIEAPQLVLTVRPRACLEPCTIRITVHIVRHPDNRWLYIAWGQSEDLLSPDFGSSSISLAGENSDPSFERVIEDLFKGEYHIFSVLYRKGRDEKGKDKSQEFSKQLSVIVGNEENQGRSNNDVAKKPKRRGK